MSVKIIQIIPAEPGWKAAYLNDHYDGKSEVNGEPLMMSRIICWALVHEEDGEARVVGMEICDDTIQTTEDRHESFWRYVAPIGLSPKELETAKIEAERLREDKKEL